MTQLIVALDQPEDPRWMIRRFLSAELPVWLKVGPQTQAWWPDLVGYGLPVFLDLKLSDTRETSRRAAQWFAASGVAAVSTFTDEATRGALEGARGSGLQVWRVVHTTDGQKPPSVDWSLDVQGIIRPVSDLLHLQAVGLIAPRDLPTICPGIRRLGDPMGGHIYTATPEMARRAGAAFAVVGSPIWGAAGVTVATARGFIQALA